MTRLGWDVTVMTCGHQAGLPVVQQCCLRMRWTTPKMVRRLSFKLFTAMDIMGISEIRMR